MKKNVCYVTGASSDILFAAANVAIGINKYSKTNDYDILIYYYGDISEQDLQAFNKIPNCIIKQLVYDDLFEKEIMHNVSTECKIKSKEDLARFASFETLLALDDYRYAIWLDADSIIQDDISSIIKYSPVGAKKDWFNLRKQFVNFPFEEYDCDGVAYQSGVVVFEDSIPYREMYSWCKLMAMEYASSLHNTDQAILNLAYLKFQIDVEEIPEEYVAGYMQKEVVTTKIVELGGKNKIWNNLETLSSYPEWYRNNLVWLDYGGTLGDAYTLGKSRPEPIRDLLKVHWSSLFPYEKVRAGSKVIIYGGGMIGNYYLSQLQYTKYCEIVAVADQDENRLSQLCINGIFPEDIPSYDFDYVVIAIQSTRKGIIREIRNNLLHMGIEETKIVTNIRGDDFLN